MFSRPQNRGSIHVQTLTVGLLSVIGAIFFLLMAFLTERVWGGEERTLYNIPYTYLHEGKVAFPAYAFTSRILYDRLYVHPPTHYLEIAHLMKLGLPLYYAEAVPALFWAMVCLALIVTAEFSFATKLGLLCGVISGGGWVATIGFWDYGFHLRPDAHMAFALLAGFLALAAAQVQGWEVRRFFLGALLLTYGSTVHYPGWCAWLGVTAFLFAAYRALPWRDYRIRLIAAVLGAGLAGIPYVVYHMLPNRAYLHQYSAFVSWARIPEAIHANFSVYRDVAHLAAWKLPQMFYALPLSELFTLGIPPFLAAVGLLIWHKETRVLALSFLPFSLFLFGIFERKLFPYYYLEGILVLIGVWLFVAWAWMKLAILPAAKWQKFAGPLLAVLFLVGFGKYTPELTRVQWKRQRHEFGFLRARAKEIVGPNATVAAIHPLWYIAGARRWLDLTDDLLRKLPPVDLRTYFSRFDDVAVLSMVSLGTRTGWNEAALYEQGILHLRGFLDSRNPPQSKLVFLSPRREMVRGFYWTDGRFFRFQEDPGGRLACVSLVVSGDLQPLLSTLAPLRYWALELPNAAGQAIPRFVLVMLLDAQRYDRGDPVLAGVKPLEAIRGNAEQMDLLSLPPPADEVDPIDIQRSYSELLASLAKPSSNGLRASVDLSPYPVNATVEPVPDRVKWFRVATRRPLTGQQLATAELPRLLSGRYYRITFHLEMETGGMAAQVIQNGQVLASLNREVPLAHASASFVVHCNGDSPLQFALAAGNSLESAPVRFRISEPVLEEVHLPD
ncbi:MAG TPA: hypothetical protein VEU96_12875 [Bryobacteraceae bacterium]|nr:hypothetical protein [Bryobacteraceae bacterium]